MTPHPARKPRRPAPEPVRLGLKEPSVEDYVHEGLKALDREDYAAATRQFRAALRKAPFRADVKELLALALDERSYKSDELHYQRFQPSLTRREPARPLGGVRHRRGRSLAVRLVKPFVGIVIVGAVALGGWEFRRWRSRPASETPIVESSEIMRVVERARGFALDGRYEEAVGALNEALRHKPSDPQPILALKAEYRCQQGVILREKRDYSGAIGHLREAVELDPQNVDYRCKLGMALHLRGRTLKLSDAAKAEQAEQYEKEARNEFETALRINPDHLEALHGLARACLALGDLDTARATWERIVEVAPPTSLEAQSARNELQRLGQGDTQAPEDSGPAPASKSQKKEAESLRSGQ